MIDTVSNLQPTENLLMIQQLARDFARNEIRPVASKYDESQEFPHEIISKLAKLGFLGAMVPEEFNGSGLTLLDFVVLVEEISKADPSVALSLCAHNGLCVGHILQFGTEAQKRQYLPDLCTGKKLGGWALTESSSGSDPAAMQTVAIRDQSDWVLSGSKTFITHGSVGSIFVIMAATGKTSSRSAISAFIVEKGFTGLSVGKKENKLGMRASDTSTLILDDVRVPSGNLLGQEGEGLKQALHMLDGGRIGIAALSIGLAQGALEASIKYSKERQQFGKQLAEFQAIQWKLADMSTEIAAARLLTHHAALLKMQGQNVNLEASQAKFFASETAIRAAHEAVQIHGGYGYIKDYPVEKLYRDARLLTIGEGTSEVQRMVIARNLLK